MREVWLRQEPQLEGRKVMDGHEGGVAATGTSAGGEGSDG